MAPCTQNSWPRYHPSTRKNDAEKEVPPGFVRRFIQEIEFRKVATNARQAILHPSQLIVGAQGKVGSDLDLAHTLRSGPQSFLELRVRPESAWTISIAVAPPRRVIAEKKGFRQYRQSRLLPAGRWTAMSPTSALPNTKMRISAFLP